MARPRSATRPLVLIIDGHDDTRELYAVGLPLFGFKTISADGASVIDRVRKTHPDVIVTEIALPSVDDGWALVKELRRNPQTSAIPVVVLTSRAEPSVRARAVSEGCAAVLLKPYPPDQLAPALRGLLHNDARV